MILFSTASAMRRSLRRNAAAPLLLVASLLVGRDAPLRPPLAAAGDFSRRRRRRRRRRPRGAAASYSRPLFDVPSKNGSTVRDRKHVRIIGGKEAPEDFYSFTVGLSDHIGLFCGGSLIAKDTVLSAAHCRGLPYDAIIGRHDLRDDDGEVIRARREVFHPAYNPKTKDIDVMLVFLQRPARKNVDLVRVNSVASEPRVGETCTVVGWGDTDIRPDESELSDVLMEVDVKAITNDECDRSGGKIDGEAVDYSGRITKNMLCARADRQDACQGDSGGPLVANDGDGGLVQVGVVSWGIGCAHRDFPGVYARLSRVHDWIEREVCEGSDYAEEAGFDCRGGGGGPSIGSGSRPTKKPRKKPTKKPREKRTKKPKNKPTKKPKPSKPKPSNNEKPPNTSPSRPTKRPRNKPAKKPKPSKPKPSKPKPSKPKPSNNGNGQPFDDDGTSCWPRCNDDLVDGWPWDDDYL